jgi:SAM-dependent methyltransferase
MSSIPSASGQAAARAHIPPLDDLLVQYQPSFVDRWDDLIDWEKRRRGEGDFFISALRRIEARRVLDAATGTGFHSVSLAAAGFDVTSVDGSATMLARAATNAARHGIALKPVHADWCRLDEAIDRKFDAVLCLGSSFPHLFSEHDRRRALAAFFHVLRPGGMLIIDHRNFDAIRAFRYRASGRYYYCGSGVAVTIAHVDESVCRFRYVFQDEASYELEVYPMLRHELRELLTQAGFTAIETYGDFRADADLDRSDFVIHTARKP